MSSSDSSSDSRDSSALLSTAKRRRLVTLAKWEEQLRKKEQESPPQIVRTMIATFTYTISKLHFVSNPPVFDRLDSVLDRLVMTYYD